MTSSVPAEDDSAVPVTTAWEGLQRAIWDCATCDSDVRVASNIRQQTEAPFNACKLLIVSLAPPFVEHVSAKQRAKSVTNDPADRLRRFLVDVLGPWDVLAGQGLVVLHAVKCAMRPAGGFQNPPADVVDVCASVHLAGELRGIRPRVIVTLGDRAYRALLRALTGSQSFPSGTASFERAASLGADG
jgi:uracil-DNA glycosylase